MTPGVSPYGDIRMGQPCLRWWFGATNVDFSIVRLCGIEPRAISQRAPNQWTGSTLVQVMACRLFGAKPLPEPMLAYCWLDSWEQISVKFESEFYRFHSNSRKHIWNCRLPKWRPFRPAGDKSHLLLLVTPLLFHMCSSSPIWFSIFWDLCRESRGCSSQLSSVPLWGKTYVCVVVNLLVVLIKDWWYFI